MVLIVLSLALLLTGFTGHAGVQVLDRVLLERLYQLHLHGVPGERAFVEAYGVPAPFVPGHCHAELSPGSPVTGPDEVLAASALAGAVICAENTPAVEMPVARAFPVAGSAALPTSRSIVPPTLPPRSLAAGNAA